MRVTAHESGSDFGHAKRKLHNRKMRSRNGSSEKWHANRGKSPIHLSRREENPKISVFISAQGTKDLGCMEKNFNTRGC